MITPLRDGARRYCSSDIEMYYHERLLLTRMLSIQFLNFLSATLPFSINLGKLEYAYWCC